MERRAGPVGRAAPDGVRVDPYLPAAHHHVIPVLYGEAFEDDPWPADWDSFDEFDPHGAFVAVHGSTPCGFSLSFRRADHGYISVVGVSPQFRRQGVASALVGAAVGYLRSIGLALVRIDAWEDSRAAVQTYESLGFRVYERRIEEE